MVDKPRRRRVLGPPPNPGERLIRKYGNRRLYDTRESRYVTLEDLIEVFDGEEPVRVVDAVTGEDLTKKVLAQALLFEEERRRQQIIPIELLRALLRHRGEREAFKRRLQRALAALEKQPEPEPPAEESGDALGELKRRLKVLETQMRRQTPTAPTRRARP